MLNLQTGSMCNLCQTIIEPTKVERDLFFHQKVLDLCENLQNGSGDTNLSMSISLTPPTASNYAIKCACCSDSSQASYFCIICNGPICDSCQNDHKVMKELRWHTLERRNLAKERSLELLKPLIICPVHEVGRKY